MTRLRLWLARLLAPPTHRVVANPAYLVGIDMASGPDRTAAASLCPVCNGLRWHWREHDGEWTTGRCPKCWGASGVPTK